VNQIWEGTSNILSLDLLRALGKTSKAVNAFTEFIEGILNSPPVKSNSELQQSAKETQRALDNILTLLNLLFRNPHHQGIAESVARQLAFAMSATLVGALLMHHAIWAATTGDSTGSGSTDLYVVSAWTRLYLFEQRLDGAIADLEKGAVGPELENVRRVALDVDSRSNLPRGMGDICPYTGKMRASY